MCDIAANLGLSLDVTFFTGHMSGPSWAPGWMLRPDLPVPPWVPQVVSGGRVVDCGYANMYTDPVALAAGELLVTTVVSRLRQHPAIGLWNLGNEPDNFARPPSPATAAPGCAAWPASSARWTRTTPLRWGSMCRT